MLDSNYLNVAYLVSATMFILGLKGLTHPKSARRGNYLAMFGMALAAAATLADPEVKSHGFIFAGVAVGGVIGTLIALRIKMTAMPQLVALLHSFVGLCAVAVAIGTYLVHANDATLNTILLFELAAGAFIGAVTFTGSLVAFGKLQGLIPAKPLIFKGRHLVNIMLVIVGAGFVIGFVVDNHIASIIVIAMIALLLGILLITPIGGADMPVIISMLNSYSGWAAAATGFALQNNLLIITGTLIGCSGAILSYIMCRAMNRSFFNVIVGGFGGGDIAAAAGAASDARVKAASVEDAVFLLENASNVIIVPGYGMAVGQAQHALNELLEILAAKEIAVKFAIHPVAGRMPGHMNVLLAEADVPYESVAEMDEINPAFATCDVALVVGANDVTNPAAKNDASSPIYGMPILEVHKAKHVFFIKRSMNPGYAGIDNQLFYQDNCSLIFGDAKEVCERLVAELRAA